MDGKTTLNITNVCFETIECCRCHILFAVTKQHRSRLVDSHESFYCPSGHPQSYVSETDLEKWKKYANNVKGQLSDCRADRTELNGEIFLLGNEKRDLEKENRYLRKMKTQYKNKLDKEKV